MVKLILVCFFTIIPFQFLFSQEEEDVLSKGIAQFTLEDYFGAIETFDSLLLKFPENKEAPYYRILCRFKLSDFYQTQKDYYRYKSIIPGPARRYLQMVYDSAVTLNILQRNFYKYNKLIPNLGYRPVYNRKDSLRGSLRFERNCYDVTFYNLSVAINPKKKVIEGKNEITFKVLEKTRKIQIDLFENYALGSILWKDKNLTYTREFDAVFVQFPEDLPLGTSQTILISYSGKPRVAPRPPWDGGFVWKKDKDRNYWCGVACEHLGASSWWPCKDHLSDEPDSMQMTYSVPEGYEVIANGTLRSKNTSQPGIARYTWFVDYPINNYNATFYLGKFSHFTDTLHNSSGSYPLDYYVLSRNLTKARTHFTQTRKIMATYEELFGDYPFMRDGFALVESPYQGMEHQGAIAYGNEYDQSSRQQVYVNKKEDMIIVHESAHEWWGNSVTVKDMTDIWIQEGFATYAEYLYFEKQYGYTEYLREIGNSMTQIFNFWPLIQNYGVNENGFASNDCYRKGAAVLQCLRSEINNDSLFFRILKEFALRYKYKTVTSADFENLVNELTSTDYSAFFNKFLRDKKLPILQYYYERVNSSIYFYYRWSEVGDGFRMPFCISDGKRNYRLESTTAWQKITLTNPNTIKFYTPFVTPEKADRNSLTYFWTSKVTKPD